MLIDEQLTRKDCNVGIVANEGTGIVVRRARVGFSSSLHVGVVASRSCDSIWVD